MGETKNRFEEILCPRRHMDDLECSRKLKIDLAFKMLSSARSDLIPHALQLLPSTKVKLDRQIESNEWIHSLI